MASGALDHFVVSSLALGLRIISHTWIARLTVDSVGEMSDLRTGGSVRSGRTVIRSRNRRAFELINRQKQPT